MQFIKLPASARELRIKHFKALTLPMFTDEKRSFDLQDKCEFLAEFSGVQLAELKATATRKQVDDMFAHILDLFEDFKPTSNPPNEITMGGMVLERVNPEKVGVAWHIDWEERMKTPENLVDIATMFYFPKGKTYGEVDVNKNTIHPLRERRVWVENEMPLFTFIECNAFFLRKSIKSMTRCTLVEWARSRAQSRLTAMRGRKRLTP